jgi:ubiquinone/menaquinone biosynthesis C-methylase UbiE
MNNKEIERHRYENMSKIVLDNIAQNKYNLNLLGAKKFKLFLQSPFLYYEKLIKNLVVEKPNLKQLDLCCGDGLHSFTAAFDGADVIALDYSNTSIEIATLRAKHLNIYIDFRVSDVEKLDFKENSFDLVTCVGSFSYVDHDNLINEIFRVLKSGGSFIVLDSFNHNLFYRINRFLHYIRGDRSFSTLQRMPNKKLIKILKNKFTSVEVSYFGIFIFLIPFLRFFLKEITLKKTIDYLDNILPFLNRYAFKIVLKSTK